MGKWLVAEACEDDRVDFEVRNQCCGLALELGVFVDTQASRPGAVLVGLQMVLLCKTKRGILCRHSVVLWADVEGDLRETAL
jgi:hypothetical protein